METGQGRVVAGGRRIIPAVILAGLALASPAFVFGQQAPAAQTPAADPLVFTADRMLVVIRVAEAQATDFEVAMARVKEVIAASDKPERKRQAAHWKILKAEQPQDGVYSYFFVLEQVEKGATYDPFKILGESLPPEEVKALFDKVGPGLRGISAAPLGPIVNMGKDIGQGSSIH